MTPSRLQDALAAKEQVWGGWVIGPTIIGPEEFAHTEYDYVGFDVQHGYLDDADVALLLCRLEHVPIATAVRLPSTDPVPIGRVLDAGADAVIIAMVELYEKLGFARVPVMAVKRKNAINEPLFTHPPETVDDLNPYARIIADEAMRRGIWVEVLDAEAGEMRLSHGGRSVVTRESLSEYTSAVAMSRCDDKRLTRRIVAEAGIAVARGRLATFDEEDYAFLDDVGDVVVKPTRGEQGKGITVGVDNPAELDAALARAREQHPDVLIEQRAAGNDLRLVVIDHKVVAAALRRPAEVTGTGHHTVRELIDAQSRRRAAATGGESRIPVDDVTEATVREAGWSFDDVLPEGTRLRVRRTANLHQGGTIHDVTAEVNPELCSVAVTAADAIGIPVTGIDLLAPDVTGTEYVFIEANERPGLANHEPQLTAQAFVDYLFPGSPGLPQAWTPEEPPQ